MCQKLPKKAKSKIPGCESFKVAVAATSDPLTVARLEFLVFTAKQLEPFLRKYQTDWPIMPFLAGDLEALLRGLLGRIIKTGKMVAATTVTKLLDIDMKSTENALPVKQVEIGFKSVLQKIPREKVSELKRMEFFTACRDMIRGIISKITERSPLYIAKVVSCLSLSCSGPQIHGCTSRISCQPIHEGASKLDSLAG